MSRNCCNTESYCCNNNCCNPCNGYGNAVSGFDGSCFYILAILLLFGGGGFGQGNFWGDYDKIFRCSGFNNAWCNNTIFSNFNNGNFSGNNLFNANLFNTGLLGGLSGNNNFDIGNLTNSSN